MITYTYLNDALRAEGKFYLGNLKTRDTRMFERMVGKILWQSKRMRAIEQGSMIDMNADRVDHPHAKVGFGDLLADAV